MNISKFIDHTYLKPNCQEKDVDRLCVEAKEHDFRAVCIPPYFVRRCADKLADSDVKVATVIGFPNGYSATAAKVEEIKRAIDDGADELDVVINISALKDKNKNYFRNDVDSITRAVHLRGKTIKIILETCMLSEEEIRESCKICIECGVNYVKTSTGMHDGATVETVAFLREILPSSIKIKASGGIRTKEQALAMIEAGADRIGTSGGLKMV